MTELKPCPFCGAPAELIIKNPVYGISGTWVQCQSCGAKTKVMSIHEYIDTGRGISTPVTNNSISKGFDHAKKAWNRRFCPDLDDVLSDEKLEQLSNLIKEAKELGE